MGSLSLADTKLISAFRVRRQSQSFMTALEISKCCHLKQYATTNLPNKKPSFKVLQI